MRLWINSALLLTIACADTPTAQTSVKPAPTGAVDLRVSSFPAEYLARRVGGTAARVQNVLPAGEDPPFWSPSGEQVAQVQQGELIVANGAGFEKWMETATLPAGRVVDTTQGIDLIHVQGTTHSHGKGGEHSHAGTDPHTWSDPLVYLQQAEKLEKALTTARPAQADTFRSNLKGLEDDLRSLDREYTTVLAPLQGRPMAANHPAFNYLARRYNLTLQSFLFDPEEAPSAGDLADFQAWADTVAPPWVIWWESTPIESVKAAFPEGVVHVYVDPLEQPKDEAAGYDYLVQARSNLPTFAGLAQTFPPPTKVSP